jgi:hypothetical protein
VCTKCARLSLGLITADNARLQFVAADDEVAWCTAGGLYAKLVAKMAAQGDERPLPQGMFDRAMREHLEMIEVRVRRLYVRPRALFAEAVVAALVDGTIVEFPNAAWDVEMPIPDLRQPVRIQVKCSGERAPQSPEKIRPPHWGTLKAPSSGKDARFGVLPAGFICDVFVFARHGGLDIERGWHFYVLPAKSVVRAAKRNTLFDQKGLKLLHAVRCEPTDLKRRVAAAAGFEGAAQP